MCGGILEHGESCVLLETLGKVLGRLRIELVEAEAANKEITQVSAAADSKERVVWQRTRASGASSLP